jgi:protein-tyrosine phosphatase
MANLVPIPFDLPGQLFRSPMPFGTFDEGLTTLDEFIQNDIDTIVMLTTPGEDLLRSGRDLAEFYKQQGWQVIHFPIMDFDVPLDKAGLDKTLEEVITQVKDGKKVAVHCFAGRGRTGLFIALLARRVLGMGGEEAIAWLRLYFPAIETPEQAHVVIEGIGGED